MNGNEQVGYATVRCRLGSPMAAAGRDDEDEDDDSPPVVAMFTSTIINRPKLYYLFLRNNSA